ncbi:MAG: alanine dehydrogenase [Calditrichaeota bacterium]|nr:MAG: alanine dehydrogenase [Calditrichota bacterium]
MIFGVPKEVRPFEYRVGLTPATVDNLVRAGHQVYVEKSAGLNAGFRDRDYEAVGAKILYNASETWGRSDVIVKVARPTEEEYVRFRKGQTLLSFLHLAVASSDLLEALRENEITAIAYETIETGDGRTPVLLTTSEVAGRLAPIIAGQLLESSSGGRGILLSGIPGAPPAAVVVIGAGVLGSNAARAFYSLGAEVTVLDQSIAALQRIDTLFHGHVATMVANPYNIAKAVSFADVLVCAVAVPGGRAPILVTRTMLQSMRPRAVIIDFSINSGGCVETSRPTTLATPSYMEEGIIHYCVPNAPAMVSRTASYALSNSVLPYLLAIGQHGIPTVFEVVPELRRGVNLLDGKLTHPGVANALGVDVELTL